MSLGKRCDEIVRLIEQTLADVTVDRGGAPGEVPGPGTGPSTAPGSPPDTAPTAPPLPGRFRRQWRWVPPTPGEPEREAAGF